MRHTYATFQFPTGWNSTVSQRTVSKPKLVSIPNGMEFYRSACFFQFLHWTFQFPTGWNSTSSIRRSWRLWQRFNSQRDGILLKEKAESKKINTSFNSQRDGILLSISCPFYCPFRVSIPNGMEFYGIARQKTLSSASFNSQRDGILPDYTDGAFCNTSSFNSQRDGILRTCGAKRVWKFLVSIPNGMEFYPDHFFYLIKQKEFQFPTGWNSTNICKTMVWCKKTSFNSQRDGILPLAHQPNRPITIVSIPNGMEFYGCLSRLYQDLLSVSIPNGMEFYSTAFLVFSLEVSFNSQRDGILRKAK